LNNPTPIEQLPLPPGNFGLPIIGETLKFLRDRKFAEKRYRQYGSIFKTKLFGSPTIVLTGADANRFLFSQENKNFTIAWPRSVEVLLGENSLALQTGNIHQQRRKLMGQAFQPRSLANYLPTIIDITNQYLEKWVNMKTLTWYPEIRNYTFDIAGKIFVGKDQNDITNLSEQFEIWVEGLFSIPINLPGTRFTKAWQARQKLLEYLEQIIQERQASNDLGTDALGILLQAEDEAGQRLPLAELKDQILVLLFGGHETLTSAIASFCLLTAQHPEVLAKARAEQKQFDPTIPISLEQLKEMTYLEQVLKEVLRLTPPVGGAFRRAIADSEYKGYRIPQGWSVQYQIRQAHKDDSVYVLPAEFDPDRFSPARQEDKSQVFSFIPFGGGLRECLGKEFARLEMKVLAAMLLRKYEWQLLPDQDLTLTTIPTPKPKDGLKVIFGEMS
jgi:cytochrome P450